MAVLFKIRIDGAGREAHDVLEAAVGRRLEQAGGPPDGLMVHVGHPEADGLVLTEVWRSEASFQTWWDGDLAAALEEAQLRASVVSQEPVWSLARP